MAASANLRREAIQLYREILRTARIFRNQKNSNKQSVETELRQSTRQEFEESRGLSNREEIYRKLVIGRDALHQIQEKIVEKVSAKAGGSG